MATRKSKVCCAATIGFLSIIVIVITTLSLTILKPKQPEVLARPLGLENIQFDGYPNVTMNVTLDVIVTIDNKNYGSFKFKNSTVYLNYHEIIVAEIPVEEDLVPARRKININTNADFMVDKLMTSPYLLQDIVAGSLNFTSKAILHGEVGMFNLLKLEANVYSTCDISLFILSQNVVITCQSKIKL
ncbi:hypothetical protein ACFE04_031011 [Oxalis oulophora]